MQTQLVAIQAASQLAIQRRGYELIFSDKMAVLKALQSTIAGFKLVLKCHYILNILTENRTFDCGLFRRWTITYVP